MDSPRLRLRARSSRATPSEPDWAKNPTRPRPGTIGARLALSRTSGSVLTMPEAVGADHPHAGGAGGGDQLPLGRAALGPGLAEAAGDDDQPAHPLAPAGLDHAGHLVGRHGEDGEVHVVGDRLDVGVGRHAARRAGRRG